MSFTTEHDIRYEENLNNNKVAINQQPNTESRALDCNSDSISLLIAVRIDYNVAFCLYRQRNVRMWMISAVGIRATNKVQMEYGKGRSLLEDFEDPWHVKLLVESTATAESIPTLPRCIRSASTARQRSRELLVWL